MSNGHAGRGWEDAVRATLEQRDEDGVLPIAIVGLPVLRRVAEPVPTGFDRGLLAELIEAMRVTMYAAPGVGLAAPQVGLGLRIAVLEDPAGLPDEIAEARDRRQLPFTVIVNPHYRQVGGARSGPDVAAWYEGCLSMPGYQAVVERAATVEVNYQDEALAHAVERYSGWQARIFQHEIDHLDGILYIDKAISRSLASSHAFDPGWDGTDLSKVRNALGF